MVEALGGIAYTQQVAEKHLVEALQALQVLGEVPEKKLLTEFARLMLARSS
jgi:geranylgeranyl pyrophosphate synthase